MGDTDALGRPGTDRGQPDDRSCRPSAPAGRSQRAASAAHSGAQHARRAGETSSPSRTALSARSATLRGASPTGISSAAACSAWRCRSEAKAAGFGLALGGAQPKAVEQVQDRRPVGRARRHPAQGDRRVLLHPGRPRARDAARPRDPADRARLAAAQLRQALARRPGRAPEELPRRRRRARMGRDPGRATT